MRTNQKKMMDYCTFCPKMCRFSCPVSEATKIEAYTPWGKMQNARWMVEKNLTFSEENVLPIYQCTNCLHCQNYCEHNIDVSEGLREVRKMAVENYVAPFEAFRVREHFEKFNNPYGVDLFLKEKTLSRPYKKKGREDLFFPCCSTVRFFPERIKTYFQLFDKLNIENITMTQESVPCCGEPLRSLGFEKEFQEIVEIQYYSMKGYKQIVIDSAECCFSFQQHYEDQGFSLKPKIIHLLEFLAPYLEHANYRTKGKVKGRLAFHDPSFLARHLNIFELPRKLITHITGFAPIDLSMSKEDTLSSGTEGAYEILFPEISKKIAERIIGEAVNRRVGKLITACSKTEKLFQGLTKEIEIQDIFEFFNEQILRD